MEVLVGEKQRDHSTVSMRDADRRTHGDFRKSGVGKTTLIRNMMLADLAARGLTRC
jgi:hypothetical protein